MTGMLWNIFVGAWQDQNVKRNWTTVCLFLPIVFLVMTVRFGFDSLRALWIEAPFLSGTAYLILGLSVPFVLVANIVRLWFPVADAEVDLGRTESPLAHNPHSLSHAL